MSAVVRLRATVERVRKLQAVAEDAQHIPARQRGIASQVRVGDYGDRESAAMAAKIIRDRLAEDMAAAGAVDRDRIRFAMRCGIMHRGPFKSANGFRFDLSPRMRAVHLNGTRYHRLNLRCANSDVRRADLLRTWRIAIAEARECARPRLP